MERFEDFADDIKDDVVRCLTQGIPFPTTVAFLDHEETIFASVLLRDYSTTDDAQVALTEASSLTLFHPTTCGLLFAVDLLEENTIGITMAHHGQVANRVVKYSVKGGLVDFGEETTVKNRDAFRVFSAMTFHHFLTQDRQPQYQDAFMKTLVRRGHTLHGF